MQGIPFVKMSGAGNDFIIVDNRAGILSQIKLDEFARGVCTQRMSLGGDQLMIIESPTSGGDFSMRTINIDGTEVKMCGNASRCVARYAHTRGIAGARMTIDTPGGPVYARVEGDKAWVTLQLTSGIELEHALIADGERHVAHTVQVSGAPHAVVYMDGVAHASNESIHRRGAAIRHHPDFPQGINVNFVEVLDGHTLWQRTFERGVEGETLACGTGTIAAAIGLAARGHGTLPMTFRSWGGYPLIVSGQLGASAADDVWLRGQGRLVFSAELASEG